MAGDGGAWGGKLRAVGGVGLGGEWGHSVPAGPKRGGSLKRMCPLVWTGAHKLYTTNVQ